jgi:hypothetical protein
VETKFKQTSLATIGVESLKTKTRFFSLNWLPLVRLNEQPLSKFFPQQ